MEWAILLFLAVVLAVHWFEYRNSVQEYTFAQPMAIDRHDELRTVLSEKTPIVVEIGALPWRPEVAAKSVWVVNDSIPVNLWLEDKQPIQNCNDLAEQMDFTTGLSDLDAARAWWWLPGIYNASVDVLQAGETVGFSWVGAERQWIGCSHGGPLLLWLVHSRYNRYLPAAGANDPPVDPWGLTVATAPWIGRVQYIEVRVQPGWCIGLPAHWGYAIKNEGTEVAWWWKGDQHSCLSLGLHKLNNPPVEEHED